MPDGVTSLEGGIARASGSGSRRDMTRPMGLSFIRQRGRRDPGSKSKEKKEKQSGTVDTVARTTKCVILLYGFGGEIIGEYS